MQQIGDKWRSKLSAALHNVLVCCGRARPPPTTLLRGPRLHARAPSSLSQDDSGTGTLARSRSRPLPLSLAPSRLSRARAWCVNLVREPVQLLASPREEAQAATVSVVRDSSLYVCTDPRK